MFEEFIPRQRFKCIEFLKMFKRLFPTGPIWDFRLTSCVEGVSKQSAYPTGVTASGIGIVQEFGGKLYGGYSDGVNPARLVSWDGLAARWVFETSNDLGQTIFYSMTIYDNKLFIAGGMTGALYSYTPGSGVLVEEAPGILGETDLFSLVVLNDILYIGTGRNGGALLKYDKALPGVLSLVLPKLSETDIHFMKVLNGKIYGTTGPDANLYEWDGISANWTVAAPDPGGDARDFFACETYDGTIFAGGSLDGKLYRWNGVNAWIEIPLPAEVFPAFSVNTSLHFLREFDGALYGAILGVTSGVGPWIIKYVNGNTYVVARPADFDNQSDGVIALAVLMGSLLAIQTNGDTYTISEARSGSSMLGILLSTFSTEMSRFGYSFNKLIREGVPGLSTTSELLTDWERVAGLPDACTSLGNTESQRQQTVHQKLFGDYSSANKQFFINYAAGLNIAIIVTDDESGLPFRTTTKTEGSIQRVTRMPNSYLSGTAADRINGSRLNSTGSAHYFTVTVTDDPEGNQDILECVFNKLKPANTQMNFIKLP